MAIYLFNGKTAFIAKLLIYYPKDTTHLYQLSWVDVLKQRKPVIVLKIMLYICAS